MRIGRGGLLFGIVLLFAVLIIPVSVFAGGVLDGALVPQCESSKNAAEFFGFVGACQLCDLAKLADNVVKFAVAFSVVVATLMFAYAGVLYFSAATSFENIKKAHGIFFKVFVGLIIILAAWLVIDMFLKVLTGGSGGRPWHSIQCGTYQQAPPLATYIPPTTGLGDLATSGLADAAARNTLQGASISVVSSSSCSDRNNSHCTSLQGIQQSTLDDLVALKQRGIQFDVTAGTEVGHWNPCHQNGTCVDIDVPDSVIGTSNSFNVQNINNVITQAQAVGRCIVFEPPAGIRCPSGVTRCEEVAWATGSHFSFYSC